MLKAHDRGVRFQASTIDNVSFLAGAARFFASPKQPNGPYAACVAGVGSQERVEKVIASIVDSAHRLVIDHRTWLISEFSDEASESAETAIDALMGELTDYCKRSRVGKVFFIDTPFPRQEHEEKCPHCGAEKVRVPWHDR